MKNFWLKRRKQKLINKKLEEVNRIVRTVIDRKFGKIGGVKSWRRKNGSKTQS